MQYVALYPLVFIHPYVVILRLAYSSYFRIKPYVNFAPHGMTLLMYHNFKVLELVGYPWMLCRSEKSKNPVNFKLLIVMLSLSVKRVIGAIALP